jgi:hypothetical protein
MDSIQIAGEILAACPHILRTEPYTDLYTGVTVEIFAVLPWHTLAEPYADLYIGIAVEIFVVWLMFMIVEVRRSTSLV